MTSVSEKKPTLNIGIVGLGKMGLLHTGILNSLDNVKIVAISEKEKVIAKYVKSSLSGVNIYEDYEKMFEAEDLDLVYITTPVSSHFPIALSCIKNKISFFVEKPLTGSLEESETLCRNLKQEHELIHSVGYNRRFIATFSKAKALLDTQILEEILHVKSSMYVSNILSKPTGWRSKKNISGGGVLLDLGAHVIDLLIWYFCPISAVSGEIKSIYSDEVEDFAHMKIEFKDGIKGELDTSWSTEGYRVPELNIEIMGRNGKMRVNEDFIKLELKKPTIIDDEFFDRPKTTITIHKQQLVNCVPIDLGGPEYTREDIHMVDCVINKRQCLINVFEASKTQSVIQGMYNAARNGHLRKKIEYFG
ncbi:MAG: Gfo/Idh/MocA family oxidoreductase [Candidatus Nitrosopolaris sp.]